MLTVTILGAEYYDEEKQEFVYPESFEIHLEHSLVSLSKWEAEFEKPFLGNKEHTDEEAVGYIRAMLIDPVVPQEVLNLLTEENILEIDAYINLPMTATWFNDHGHTVRSNEIITNELIYYWMSQFNIPQECENWHLNRLITRIKLHAAKMEKPKKMNKAEQARQFRELNAARREKYNSKG